MFENYFYEKIKIKSDKKPELKTNDFKIFE